MKKQLLLSFFALLIGTFLTSAQTTPVCGGMFTDPAGPNLNYANSSDYTVTICPTNPGEVVTVIFTSFDVEANYDGLYIYNGNSTSAPQIASNNPANNIPGGLPGAFWGTTSPGTITSTSPDGCLTFRFRSDSSVNKAGWIANVLCEPIGSCPAPVSVFSSSSTTDTITLSWLEIGNSDTWEVLVLPCGTVPTPNNVGIIANTNPFVISNLIPDTCYNIYVRSICSATSVSLWSTPYTVSTSTSCAVPTNLFASNFTNETATFGWSPNGTATSWEVIALPCASLAPTATSFGTITTTPTFTFTGLNPNTCYKLYVRALCDANQTSVWSTGLSVTTTAVPIVTPVCGGSFTDNGGLNANYANSSDNTYTICPTIAGEMVTVIFNTFDTEANWDGLYVYNGNSITSPQISSSNPAGNVPGGLPGAFWGTTIPEVITSSSPDGCLTFRFRSDSSVNKPGWDASVVCGPFTYCQKPTNVTTSDVLYNSATIAWTENNSASQWEIIVQLASLPAPTSASTGVITSSNPYSATGLVSGSTYKAYIRSICSATSSGNWAFSSTFTTPTCSVPTSIITNGVNATGAIITWAAGVASQWEVIVLLATDTAPTANTSGTIVYENSYTATGLTTGVNYKFYIRAICGVNFVSNWSAGYSFTPYASQAPLVTNTTTYTPEQLINNVLVNNPCITISNVTSSTGTNFGSTNGIGYFTNTNPTFPLASGIVLSTGNVDNIPGPNTSTLNDGISAWTGDTQLENIISAATGTAMISKNATKLEFDFTSLNEFMSFNFLFASEEYGAFQCTFADAFAFLLTDLETGVTTNLAVVPGTTTPISVVTIRDTANNTSCASVNPDFFDTYFSGASNYSSATNFNGQTVEMTASSTIIPNHPYHIKLVVADRSDNAYDSAVFIKAGSFTSGPPECADKINLVAFVDSNNNGTQDSGEANFSYGSFVIQQNNTGPISNINSPFGTYTVYDANSSNTYDFSFSLDSEYATYYSAGTTSFNDVNIALGSGTQTLYFPITLVNGYNDVTVSIVPVSAQRPGFTYTNKIVYRNLGVTATSGTISFTKDPNITITSVSQSGIVSNANGFTYDFTNLTPYETRFINVTMSVPAIPVVNINDVLTNNVNISAPSGDINLSNNAFSNAQIVVASYDPNDKMESHGDKIQFNQFSADDYLYYTIRFQNEGTANAIDVRIEDLLDSKIDETSIRMISASHNYLMHRVNNQIIWKFDYINLPPALSNEELSKGYVFFKVKLKPGFAIGDIIPNTAEIYFDTNPAIITNTFNTEFVTALSTLGFESGNFVVFPNPASNFVQINLQNNSQSINSVVIYDVLGKEVKSISNIDSNQVQVNTSNLSSGIYMIEVTTDNGLKQVKKLVIK